MVAAVLGILMEPRLAAIVLGAAMLPYGVAELAHPGRVLRGLHGGDQGAVTAGALAQVLVPVVGMALAAAGLARASMTVFAGGMMLAATGQALRGASPDQAARAAVGAVQALERRICRRSLGRCEPPAPACGTRPRHGVGSACGRCT